jgi:hypothetical protein
VTSRLARATLALSVITVVAACNESLTIPPGSTGPVDTSNGTISLATSSASTTVQVGGSNTTTLTVTRGLGYNGAVVVTLEGVPAGVSATANPSTIPASSATSTITFTVAPTTTPNNAIVTVRGTGTRVADATTNVALVMTPPSASASRMTR